MKTREHKFKYECSSKRCSMEESGHIKLFGKQNPSTLEPSKPCIGAECEGDMQLVSNEVTDA